MQFGCQGIEEGAEQVFRAVKPPSAMLPWWDKPLHIYLTYKMCGAERKLNVSYLGRCIHGNTCSLLKQDVGNGVLVGV